MRPVKKYNEGGELSNKEFRQNERFQRKSEKEKKLIRDFAKGDTKKLMAALEGSEEYMKFLEKRGVAKGLGAAASLAALSQIVPAAIKLNRRQSTELGGRRNHTG
jgi:uncharacterized FAD-dependent dehydrogenase